jgi:Xaa-Pro aminopeptidase
VKSDINRLMREADLDGLLVMGAGQHNPFLTYLVGRAHLTDAVVVKKRDAETVLFHRSMERGEAEATGLALQMIESFDWAQYLEQTGGDSLKARALRLADMVRACSLEGRVALYGQLDLSSSYPLIGHLKRALPEIEWAVEPQGETVLEKARLTKDSHEIEQIRQMGQVTTDVVAAMADFLTRQRVADGHLVDAEGKPITVGSVKARVRRLLAERNAELPSGLIFSVGRDAALPHSVGDDSQTLPVGQTIVFDIYPAQAGGGYYYDFTRTWCLGEASDEILAIYRDVLHTYERFASSFRVGEQTYTYQVQVCQAFQALGHPTVLDGDRIQSGYVHGLGHGLGLAVHEPPAFSANDEGSLELEPGMVFTFEPGLYYPDRRIGVRIEDTMVVEPDGAIHPLVDYPKDLILPVSGS